MKDSHIQLVRPPVPVRPPAMDRVGVCHRTLARTLDLGIHNSLHCVCFTWPSRGHRSSTSVICLAMSELTAAPKGCSSCIS
ncbi:hypothetical protein SAMCCGM7_pC1420 (plasmid) [Sinorhizobium americanum CCGM7]|nr:hypothetical protein SAMCCGM7_pC1420 [Sinorhizobium americanum CCGM7]